MSDFDGGWERPGAGGGGGAPAAAPTLSLAALAVARGYAQTFSGDWSVGMSYYPFSPCTQTGARIYKPSAGTSTIKVSLYDARNPASQVLLTSKTITASQGWNAVTFDAAQSLTLATGMLRLQFYDSGGNYHAAQNGAGGLRDYDPGIGGARWFAAPIVVADCTLYAAGDNPTTDTGGFYGLIEPVIT